MKRRLTSGIVFIILGFLAAILPRTLFPVCEFAHNEMGEMGMGAMKMICSNTATAELITGIILAALGIAYIVLKGIGIEKILTAITAVAGISVIILPFIAGLCNNPKSSCREAALPALIVIGAITLIYSVANLIYLFRKERVSFEKEDSKKDSSAVTVNR